MEILLATTNQNKIDEFSFPFLRLGFHVLTLKNDRFAGIPEPEETESSFSGNALLKSRHYANETGLLTVADDSGICVDVLNGAPGVFSGRYSGETVKELRDESNRRKLLRAMASYAFRKARIVVSMCAVTPDHSILAACERELHGEIAQEERGSNGWGYESIFILKHGINRHYAELSRAEQFQFSPRVACASRMAELLENNAKASLY